MKEVSLKKLVKEEINRQLVDSIHDEASAYLHCIEKHAKESEFTDERIRKIVHNATMLKLNNEDII